MIAILLATYNGATYLREQIDSILNQDMNGWHLYVHDDGSTDGTMDILKEYHTRYPDIITTLDYPSQGGAMKNFLSMLQHVDAEYYMFSDQDDVWHTDKVSVTFKAMQEAENGNTNVPVVIHTDLNVVDKQLNRIHPSFFEMSGIHPERIKCLDDNVRVLATGCTMMINNAAKKAAFMFDVSYATMHDAWIVATTFAADGKVIALSTATIDYRQHGDNTLGAPVKGQYSMKYHLTHLAETVSKNYAHYRMLLAVGYKGNIFSYINKKISIK